MEKSIKILGCGSSGGVPRVGNNWGDCDPNDPRNRRGRCSAIFSQKDTNGTTSVLIDTSPDLREQFIREQITNIDAVFFTHSHADHIHGIDDLRPLALELESEISAFADAETAKDLLNRFGYVFNTPIGSGYRPFMKLNVIEHNGKVSVDGMGGEISLQSIEQKHGSIISMGYRFDEIAYCVDLSFLPENSKKLLFGIDILIIDCLQKKPHNSHANLSMALQWISEINPKLAILTDLHTSLDYAQLESELPLNIVPATDGMTIKYLEDGVIQVIEPITGIVKNFP